MTHSAGHLPPDNLPPDPAELADLYAAGALSREEAAGFEKRVAAGEPGYVAEHKRILPVLEMLLHAAPEITPPGCARRELARDIGADGSGPREESPFRPQTPDARREELVGAMAGGIAISRLAEGRWYPTGVKGVRFRHLHASRRENRRTIILQMDPGTELPEHDHTGTEEITMISGDLQLAGTTLGPGDYIRIAAGADHGVPRTVGGCTCIITSGYQPFPVTSWLRMGWSVVRGWFGK